MKNRFSVILGAVTALFVVFTLGVFLGRAGGRGDVYISEYIPDTAAVRVANPVPSSQDPSSAAEIQASPSEPVLFPIDINTANAQLLEQLPGIGPVLAERIVNYREANGPFRSIGELTRVEGIGQTKLEEILNMITIQEDTP